MSKGIKARCEKCNKVFYTEATKVQVRKLGEGIEEVYFECPNNKCRTRFRVALTDERIREIHRLLRKANFAEALAMKLELKERMDKLNGKVGE